MRSSSSHGNDAAAIGSVRSTRRTGELVASPAVWIGAVVMVSVVTRILLGSVRPSPWILPDELLYTELARAVADGGPPAVRGVTTVGWGVVYPILIAPAWALADDPVVAYHAMLAISAIVVSLAAIPAYLLARLFVRRAGAVAVAVGATLAPAMVTGVVMTENAAYPAFLLALWLIARTVRTPTVLGQGSTLLVIAALTLTRVQGAVLLPAFVVAAALYALTTEPGMRLRYVRRFLPTVVVSLTAVGVPALLATVLRRDVGWFGERSDTFENLSLGDIPRLLLFQTGDVVLLVVVLPAFATAVVAGMGLVRGAVEAHRLFASVAVPTVAAVLGSVAVVSATYEIDGSEDVNERYVFYVVPILLLGMALWIATGLARPRWSLSVVVGVAAVPALLPFDRLEIDASFYAPGLAIWVALPLPSLATGVVVACCGLALGLLFLRCPRERATTLWLITLVGMALVAAVTLVAHTNHARTAAASYGTNDWAWVDDAVPDGATVTILWDQRRSTASGRDRSQIRLERYFQLMLTEFFNPTIGTTYRLGASTIYEDHLPTRQARIGPHGIWLDERGRPLAARYVLAPCDLAVDGRRMAASSDGDLVLTRAADPVRVDVAPACGRIPGRKGTGGPQRPAMSR